MDDIKSWLNDPAATYAQGVQLLVEHCTNAQLRWLFLHEDETPYKRTRLRKELLEIIRRPMEEPAKEVPQNTQQRHQHPPPIVDVYDVADALRDDVVDALRDDIGANHGDDVEALRYDVAELQKDVAALKNAPTITAGPHKGWHHPSLMDEVEKTLFLKWKPLQAERKHLMATIYQVGRAGITDPSQEQDAGRMALRILALREIIHEIYQERDEYFQTGTITTAAPVDPVVDPRKWPLMLANAQKYVRNQRAKLKKDPTDTKAAALLAKWQSEVDKYKKLLDGE